MDCIICGKETQGSVGRAGLKWKRICQACKDKEDDLLEARIKNICDSSKLLMRAMFGVHND